VVYTTLTTNNAEAWLNSPAQREIGKWPISVLLLLGVAISTPSSLRLEIVSFSSFSILY
jgi:hypothetical protein